MQYIFHLDSRKRGFAGRSHKAAGGKVRRFTIKRWVYRSSFEITRLSMTMAGKAVDREWYGKVIIEAEGTYEGGAKLLQM